jgi:hypothetical protein
MAAGILCHAANLRGEESPEAWSVLRSHVSSSRSGSLEVEKSLELLNGTRTAGVERRLTAQPEAIVSRTTIITVQVGIPWAKVLMMMQSLISFATVALLAARTVNSL